MAQWKDLPYELQELILDQLFRLSSPTSSNNKGGVVGRPLQRTKPDCIGYLTTCKTWKQILEPRIYQHLFLTSSTLSILRRLNCHQQNFVQYIWLAIELQGYDCPDCIELDLDHLDDSARRQVDAALVDTTLWQLFYLLRGWSREGFAKAGNLTLEISVFSKSDMEHVFWNHLHFDSSPFTPAGELEIGRPRLNDRGHGWKNGQLMGPHELHSIQVITQGTSSVYGDLELQPVPAVNKFIIRRQTRRQLPIGTLEAMLEKLPNLNSIVLEPWRSEACFPETGAYPNDTLSSRYILRSLPNTLKHLILFEDFNEDYCRIYATDPVTAEWVCRPELHRTPSVLIAQALAQMLGLEKLAASYLIDAHDFFTCAKDYTSNWHTLSSLYLTSRQLVPETDTRRIDGILALAGQVALRMPALDTMVIWYGAKGVASEFRYEITDGRNVSVQWRATFGLPFIPEALEAWRKVAEMRGLELTVKTSRTLPADEFEAYSHGAVISRLGLVGHVVHPVSLEQICCETRRYWFK
ncbi:hypothetical protein BM221_005734 [Beauveria bassiana]|uniref:DUF6546 domain-containing protein n=1 Tax=Beauveria bassiana TaxID=176275 RepID=A0A2N6NPF2_BEABA|nr:hypothetical protein BM221_005734 [Beauveria bassiana]